MFFFEPFRAARFRRLGFAEPSSGRENQKIFAPLSRACGNGKANSQVGGLKKVFLLLFLQKKKSFFSSFQDHHHA
jgi:hypothetical protein